MSYSNLRTVGAALLVTLAASGPALAKVRPVTLPSATVADDTARLCMPKTTLPAPTKEQPTTICQSVGEWKAQGVTFVGK